MSVNLYILENNEEKHYVGITKLDVLKRLERHNDSDVFSTKFGKPWKVIYSKEYPDYQTARVKEKEIKSWHGGSTFKKFVATAGGSSNGRTPAFGAVNSRFES